MCSCGPHGIEEERRILLLLGVREGLFLLQFFDQVVVRIWEGCACRFICLFLVSLIGPFHIRDGPCKSRSRGVIGLVLAQDVQ